MTQINKQSKACLELNQKLKSLINQVLNVKNSAAQVILWSGKRWDISLQSHYRQKTILKTNLALLHEVEFNLTLRKIIKIVQQASRLATIK